LTSPSIDGNAKLGPVASSMDVSLPASASQLFGAYNLDKQPKISTISRWRVVFTARWMPPGRLMGQIGTPSNGWIRSARRTRTVFGWAVRKRRVSANPFEGCTVEVPRTSQTRETKKEFTEAEAQTILRASDALGNPTDPGGRQAVGALAVRLLGGTGRRAYQLTQLRVQDIQHRACGHVLRITPDAGTVKTGKARTVPIFRIWSRWVCWTTSRRSRLARGSRGRCSSGVRHDLPVTPAIAMAVGVHLKAFPAVSTLARQ
jgi:integrase